MRHNKWLGYGGEHERLFKNGIILTSLSRNFYNDGIRGHAEAAVCKLN